MDREFQFLMYRSANEDVTVNAGIKDETIWLTQNAMAELFAVDKSSISRHLRNIFAEDELDEEVAVAKLQQPLSTARWWGKPKRGKRGFIISMRSSPSAIA